MDAYEGNFELVQRCLECAENLGARRLQFALTESCIVEKGKKKWIRLPESFELYGDDGKQVSAECGASAVSAGRGTTLLEAVKAVFWGREECLPNGVDFEIDSGVLSSLKFCLTRGLVEAVVVVERRGDGLGDDDGLGSAGVDIVLRDELVDFVPTDLISSSGPRERYLIQRLVQVVRSYPSKDVGSSECGRALRDEVFVAVKPVDCGRENARTQRV